MVTSSNAPLQHALAGAAPTWIVDDVSPEKRRSRSLTWIASVASAWAYADLPTFEKVMRLCLGDVAITPIQAANCAVFVDTQAYFVRAETLGLGLLVFRGTELGGSWVDVLTDVAVEPVAFEDEARCGLVHGGFYRGLLCVWHDVLDALDGHRDLRHLVIAGHSLGGALAALAAVTLFSDLDRELDRSGAPAILRQAVNPGDRNVDVGNALWDAFDGLYTFGQPMVGDARFRELAADVAPLTYRHVYLKDWVPRLPPADTGAFVHFGAELTATDDGWAPSTAPVSAVGGALTGAVAAAAFLLRQFPRLRPIPLPWSLADHSPQNYVEISKRGVPRAPALFP